MWPSEAVLLFGAILILSACLAFFVFAHVPLREKPAPSMKLALVFPREAKDAFEEMILQVPLDSGTDNDDITQKRNVLWMWVFNMKKRLLRRTVENTINVKNSHIFMLDMYCKMSQQLANKQDYLYAKYQFDCFTKENIDIVSWAERLEPGWAYELFREASTQAKRIINENL